MTREHPKTSDILVTGAGDSFRLHKFILSARSPYFSKKLRLTPAVTSWKLPHTLPPQSFSIAISYLYFGELPNDVGGGPGTGFSEEEVLHGIDKIAKHLEIRTLFDEIIEGQDRKYARQRRIVEIEKGRDQMEKWFDENILKYRVNTDVSLAEHIQWDRDNALFADVLLRADDSGEADEDVQPVETQNESHTSNIPIGPSSKPTSVPSEQVARRSVLFPAHKAMLLRSEYFATMFSSSFREAQDHAYLQIIKLDCNPEVLEIVLRYIYTEKTDMSLEMALEVLYAADVLLIDKLKARAAVTISTLGSGSLAQIPTRLDSVDSATAKHASPKDIHAEIDVFEIVRAGWQLRVPRLEEFGARYMAFRLETFIDTPEFEEIVKESAERITAREETDTIELLDDIRYYLSERFRLRFEDAGLEEMMDEEEGNLQRGIAESKAPAPKEVAHGTRPGTQGEIESAVRLESSHQPELTQNGTIRTLDGKEVKDEMEEEAMNYQILLGKIDRLLEKLKLDA